MLKKVIKSGAYGLVSKVLLSLSQIFYIPLMLANFGKSDFGLLAVFLSLNAFISLSSFGISKKMQNVISGLNCVDDEEKINDELTLSLFSIIKLSLPVCTFFILSTFLLYYFSIIEQTTFKLSLVFIASAFLILLINVFFDFYRGCQLPDKANRYSLILNLLIIFLTSFSLFLKLSLFKFYVISYFIPQLLFFSYVLLISKDKSRIKWRLFFKVEMNTSTNEVSKLFFLLTVIQFFGFGLDTFMVAVILEPSDSAEYNIVLRFYSFVIFGFSVFSASIWPFFAKFHSNKQLDKMRNIYFKGVKVSFIYGLVSFFCLSFISPYFVENILRVQIVNNEMLYILMGFQAMLVINTSFIIPLLNAMNYLKKQVLLGLISSISNIVLTIFLLKIYGVIGAPIATILSHLIFGSIPLNYILYKALKNA